MKLTNEEKCTYCREYGNLPCEECDKKLEAKKAMSKRLEEIKDEYAQSKGFNDWTDLWYSNSSYKFSNDHINSCMEIYAREVAKASLEKASEEATINHQNGEVNENIKYFQIDSRIIRINKQSIINPDNIVLF